jgi:hypothetical protein
VINELANLSVKNYDFDTYKNLDIFKAALNQLQVSTQNGDLRVQDMRRILNALEVIGDSRDALGRVDEVGQVILDPRFLGSVESIINEGNTIDLVPAG